MRVTFVLPPVNMSGGIRVAAIYAKQLQRMGHAVTLVSPPPCGVPARRKVMSLLRGQGWPSDSGRTSHLNGAGLDHRVLEQHRPVTDRDVPDADVVVATWWETAEWVNALHPRKGAKVYFIQHHEVFGNLPVERCHATYRMPMHKIVIARWLQRTMHTHYGDDTADLVPNSVDTTQFFAAVRDKQPVPTVGLLYSTAGFKGVDRSLAAIAVLKAWVDGLQVISFGTERPATKLPLPDYVKFSYLPPQERLRDLYARCDVWITASTSEGFNLPAMEAMACRTPVVSTRTGWPEEALESGLNGVLVDVDDVEALARGAQWVLSLPSEEWKTLSRRAFETATAGSWEQSARLFERALTRARERAARGEIAGGFALGVPP